MKTNFGICPKCGYEPAIVWAKITPARRRVLRPLTDEMKSELVEMHLLACNGKHPDTWEGSGRWPKVKEAE